MANLAEEAGRAFAALNEAGVNYGLVGGLAVSLYAKPRATLDIDLLVSPTDLGRALEVLGTLGFEPLPTAMRFANVNIRRVTKIGEQETFWIDLVLAEEQLASILARRQVLMWEHTKLPVVKPEDLITLKRLRGSKQDLADIEAIEEALRDDATSSDTSGS